MIPRGVTEETDGSQRFPPDSGCRSGYPSAATARKKKKKKKTKKESFSPERGERKKNRGRFVDRARPRGRGSPPASSVRRPPSRKFRAAGGRSSWLIAPGGLGRGTAGRGGTPSASPGPRPSSFAARAAPGEPAPGLAWVHHFVLHPAARRTFFIRATREFLGVQTGSAPSRNTLLNRIWLGVFGEPRPGGVAATPRSIPAKRLLTTLRQSI